MTKWLAVLFLFSTIGGGAEPTYRVLPLANPDFSQSWGLGVPNGWQLFASEVGSRGDYYLETVWRPSKSNCLYLRTGNTGSRVGVYQRVDLNQSVAHPVYVEMFARGNQICIDPTTNFGLSLYVEVYYQDGSRGFFNTPRDWGTFWCEDNWRVYALNLNYAQFNPATGLYDNLPLPKPISHLFVIPLLADASGEALIDNVQVREYFGAIEPAVTLQFDDAEESIFTVAWPEMIARGYKGSLVIPIFSLHTEEHLTEDQVRTLAADGWSVESHGFDNELGVGQGFLVYSPRDARAVYRSSREALQTIIGSLTTVDGFAYPFGAYWGGLTGVAQPYYASARLFEQRANPAGCPRWNLAVRGTNINTTREQVREWLRDARDRRAWVNIVMHGLKASDVDLFYNTPEQFNTYLDEIAASGLRVLTYKQAVAEFCANPQGGIYGGRPSAQ